MKRITASGRVWGEPEVEAACAAVRAGHWTARFEAVEFERQLAARVGVRKAAFCNSGSSANLLALSALGLPKGSEVITPACTFPTTVAAILHAGLVPVFVDVEIGTYNTTVESILNAIGSNTKAAIIPHTLGNPVDILALRAQCDLLVIEDACDAFGSKIHGAPCGSLGHLATLSFYPAHHATTGQGGAVLTNDPALDAKVRSLCAWGRACWCAPAEQNTCGKRFEWEFEGLPAGYDHKYTFSEIGFNLAGTDIQAAIGIEQLKRLDGFHAVRQRNWQRLHDDLRPLSTADTGDHFTLPSCDPIADPSWFGFAVTLCKDERRALVNYLDLNGIDTRPLFAGNVLRQPGFKGIPHRISGTLTNTDVVTERTFWVGCWPGLDDGDIDRIVETFHRWYGGGR